MWLDLLVLAFFTLVLTGLVLVYGASLRFISDTIAYAVGCMALNIAVVLPIRLLYQRQGIYMRREVIATVRDWMPFTLLLLVYENLRLYTGVIRPVPIDSTLAAIDELLFGVQPTIWIQKFAHPVLTDLMAFTYDMYFPMPLSLLVGLYVMGRRTAFREMALTIVVCIFSGFILFLIFPAGPPRFYLQNFYQPPQLTGYFELYDRTEKIWDAANQMIVHSSFPSLHVALSTIAMIYAHRRDHWPRAGLWLGPLFTLLTVSLWLSTVYLRHHWVTDIIAGGVLGIVSVSLAHWIFERLRSLEGVGRSSRSSPSDKADGVLHLGHMPPPRDVSLEDTRRSR